jgi:hypothetical protein
MVRKHFITYGNHKFTNSLHRICKEAEEFAEFETITGYSETDLRADTDFWEKHGEFIEQNPRGGGYWVWKPYLIQKKLNELKDGEYLLYCDAGCEINPNGRQRFLEYIRMLETNGSGYGLLLFTMNYTARQWTKNAIFEYFMCDDSIRESSQNVAGVLLIKKNAHSVHLIYMWNKSMLHNLINDVTGIEDPEFIENRHDQSIFSILVNTYGSVKLPDETYFPNWDDGRNYPFLAKRICG